MKQIRLSPSVPPAESAGLPKTNNTPAQKPITSAPSKEELAKTFDATSSADDDFVDGKADVVDQKSTKVEAPTLESGLPSGKQGPALPEAERPKVAAPASSPEARPGVLDGLRGKAGRTVAQGDATASPRDYAGFTDEEVKTLKSMSNDAFNYVAPILKERKQQQQVSSQSIFQHPDAYQLHPEFKRINSELSYSTSEANAWNEQLMKMRIGEKWQPLVGVDPKTGKFIYGDEREPTPQDEEMVRQAMSKCLNVRQNAETQLQQMPQQFQQVVENDAKLINEERAKRFDWVRDPSLMDFELDVEGVGKKKISNIRGDFINLFPAYQRNTIGVDVAADMFVTYVATAMQLREARAEKAIAETLKNEATRIEPTTTNRQKPNVSKFGVSEFSIDGMPD